MLKKSTRGLEKKTNKSGQRIYIINHLVLVPYCPKMLAFILVLVVSVIVVTCVTDTEYDVIVIGSGVGGLATASILARDGQKKVLVLEKEHPVGGAIHAFSRHKVEFPVGHHWVELNPIFLPDTAVVLGEVPALDEMSVNYENVTIGTSSSDTYSKYAQGLEASMMNYIGHFPECDENIIDYITDISGVLDFLFMGIGGPGHSFTPLGLYFDMRFASCARKEKLTTLVGIHILDAGGAPASYPLYVTAMMEWSYGTYGLAGVSGGSQSLVDDMMRIIATSETGSIVKRDSEVIEITTDPITGAATGVKSQRKGGNGMVTTYTAPIVVSDIGIKSTFIPSMMSESVLAQAGYTTLAADTTDLHSTMLVWLTFDATDEALGFPNSNIFYAPKDDAMSRWDEFMEGPIPTDDGNVTDFISYVIAFSSGRESDVVGDRDLAYVTIMIPAPFQWMAPWEDSFTGSRPQEYYDWKDNFMIRKAREVFYMYYPDAEVHEKHVIGATPLTIRDYISATSGSYCGVQWMDKFPTPVTNIPGLFLVGKDVSCGVFGAMSTGMMAAGTILNPARRTGGPDPTVYAETRHVPEGIMGTWHVSV